MNTQDIIALDKNTMNTFGDRLPVVFEYGHNQSNDKEGKAYTDFWRNSGKRTGLRPSHHIEAILTR